VARFPIDQLAAAAIPELSGVRSTKQKALMLVPPR
jgi:hypothetical protein